MIVLVQVAVFGQGLAHVVQGQAPGLAQYRLAEHRRRDLFLRIDAPFLLRRIALDAAQLGDGHEQRVLRRVDDVGVGFFPGLRADAVSVRHLARQELPGTVNRLAHDLAPGVDALLGAQGFGFLLQPLECARLGVAQPFQISQAAFGQLRLGLLGGVLPQGLVGGEFFFRHARLLRRLKQWQHAAPVFRRLDFLVGGQHTVHDAADFVSQFDIQRRQFLVDVDQPRPEPLEQALQFDAGRLALEQIGFEATGELFVIAALFLEVQIEPGGEVRHAEPTQQRFGVGHDLPFAFGQVERGGLMHQLGGHVHLHFQKEVAGLMQEGGQIGVFQQPDGVGFGAEETARSLFKYLVRCLPVHAFGRAERAIFTFIFHKAESLVEIDQTFFTASKVRRR